MTIHVSLRLSFVFVALMAHGTAFAQVVLHQISGMAWRDRVPDGIRAPHEQGLGVPEHPVDLLDGTTGVLLRSTVTDANGRYVFSYGSTQTTRSYRVSTTRTFRYERFSPHRAGADPALDSDILASDTNTGQSPTFVVSLGTPGTNIDIGLVPYVISLGNLAWFDRNGNGQQSQFERGLQGLQVEAWNSERTIRFATSVTDVDGIYRLGVPGWGPYRIRFESPEGTSFTERAAGSDPNNDSDVFPTGANTGWTSVISMGANTLSMTSVDAGYLVAENGADVALHYDMSPVVVFPGFSTTWTLRVREGLGETIASVRVRAAVPASIQGMSWTCSGTFSATCPSAGTNAVDFITALPNNSELTIEFSGQVAANAGPIITAVADAIIGAPQWDVIPLNSSAELLLRNDRLFRDGFQ